MTSPAWEREDAGQQVLAGMPERLYACTPSRLLTWADCPRRYRFAYLDRPQPGRGPAWAHTSVGAATHNALAQWYALPVARRSPGRGADLVRVNWPRDGFRDDAQSSAVRDRAAGWVRDYLRRIDPAVEPAGVERVVSAHTGTLALSGRADRIDRRDGRLVVVDYKTGRRAPTDQDARASLPLAVYAVAAARTLRHPSGRVELHHLPSATLAVADHDEASLAAALRRAEAIAADAAAADAAYRAGRTGDEDFPAAPSPACSWCDWRRHCREGRAAAPDVEPWSGLPGEEQGGDPGSGDPGGDGGYGDDAGDGAAPEQEGCW